MNARMRITIDPEEYGYEIRAYRQNDIDKVRQIV
jgi:hypothetical protein